MTNYEKVSIMYEYFFCEVSGRKNFSFNPKATQKKMVENFIKSRKDEIGDEWLYEYFLFQFSRYYDKNTRFGKGVVQLGWVIGKKAIQEWLKKSPEQLYYVNQFRRKYTLKSPLKKEIKYSINEDYLNTVRKRGNLIHCLENEAYSKMNKYCMKCKKCKL